MPDTCADQLSTSLRRDSDIPPEYDAWSATALSPLSMHDAIPRRLKFPATSPASVSPAGVPTTFPSSSTLRSSTKSVVRPAYSTNMLSGNSPPRSSPSDFQLNHTSRRDDLGALLRQQYVGSLMRGDGGRATLEADPSTHLGELSGIHPQRGPTSTVGTTCRHA